MTGTFIACTSSSWILSWLGLELNLIRIIPLILFKLNFNSTESAIKYFIPQALASLILIVISRLQLWDSNLSRILPVHTTLILALALKSGMAPLHFWFPQVIAHSNWNICALFLVWQKIAPFVLLSSIYFNELSFILIVASRITGALGGLNLLNTKLILTYSSIAHSSWILASLIWSLNLWATYFLIYSNISLAIVIFLNCYKINIIQELSKNKISNVEKGITIFNIMSLAGLPPV